MKSSNSENASLSLKANVHNVLLIEEDPKEIELYSDLVREVAQCKIDVMSQPSDFMDWGGRSNYHLVIVDELDTDLALLEQIKRVNPSTSVIILARDATIEQAVAAIRLGAEDYLSKPFKVEAFQLAVKRGLDRKMVFSENTGASQFLHLLNSCQMISASLEQNKIFEIVQSYLSRELNAGYSAIYSFHGDEPIRVDSYSGMETGEGNAQQDRTLEEILNITIRASGALSGMSDTLESYRFVERGQLTPSLFLFRFQCAGQSDYFCICLSPEKPTSLEEFEGRLRLLKAQIEVTGRNIEHYLGVQKLVYVDDVTGLYNTRYLHYILEREIAQSQASKKSFAVLFIDADKFKGVNDTHGHLIGTKLLNELGNHLKKYVREKDTVFRYGGDEFVAILSPCDLKTANAVAERIRESVEQEAFLSNEGLEIHFTVSMGVALFPEHGRNKKEIIEAADHAMYQSKRNGRNSVSISKVTLRSLKRKGA